jgi:hypothetical protein
MYNGGIVRDSGAPAASDGGGAVGVFVGLKAAALMPLRSFLDRRLCNPHVASQLLAAASTIPPHLSP